MPSKIVVIRLFIFKEPMKNRFPLFWILFSFSTYPQFAQISQQSRDSIAQLSAADHQFDDHYGIAALRQVHQVHAATKCGKLQTNQKQLLILHCQKPTYF